MGTTLGGPLVMPPPYARMTSTTSRSVKIERTQRLPYWLEIPEISSKDAEKASKQSKLYVVIEGVRSAPILA